MKKLLLAGLLLCLCANAHASDVAWVKIADHVYLDRHHLQLNGAGVRSRLSLDVYIAGLYLADKKFSPAAVFADDGEKRMALHVLRDISADQLLGAFSKAITDNNKPAELAGLEGPIRDFSAIFRAMMEVKHGDVITLDYLPGRGTWISVNGKLVGTIAGTGFYTALLKIWLGDNPVQEDLKQKLLGQK